jgi:hypothetical protein
MSNNCNGVRLFRSKAVRDQMRKLAVGGPAGTQDEKNAIYEVSDSEDEDLDEEGRYAPSSLRR